MFKLGTKHIAACMLIGLGFSVIMGFMYMQYVYYDAMIETFKVTNEQLGLLITILGVTGLITCIPGGIIADKFDCRKVMTYSLAGMMLFCALLAIIPTYQIAFLNWAVGGCIMSAWYTAVYKVIRIIAPPESIGKSFGVFGVGVAVGSILVNVAGLALYDYFAQISLSTGLSSIFWAFFIAGTISCIGGHLLIMKIEVYGEITAKGGAKTTLSDFVRVIKDPGSWLYVLGCFCIYSFQVSISYFTPYFTAVFGTTIAFSGIVAVFRQYGLRIISSPLGGLLGDKLGSTAKVIRGSMCILGVLVAVVLFLPTTTPLAVLVAIVLILGLLGTMNISLQASISKDAMVPPKNMGVVVGMTSLFSADLFQATLFGNWLDNYGNGGYTYIWIYTLCIIVLDIIVLTVMVNRRKRIEGALK
jgi:predicted MFS family arabinose efflux permease